MVFTLGLFQVGVCRGKASFCLRSGRRIGRCIEAEQGGASLDHAALGIKALFNDTVDAGADLNLARAVGLCHIFLFHDDFLWRDDLIGHGGGRHATHAGGTCAAIAGAEYKHQRSSESCAERRFDLAGFCE